MGVESPLIHDGAQCILGFDARNSTFTGTTLPGPSGSGQFLAVALGSTNRSLALAITSTRIYGILQNKGSTGQVADVGIFGISKAVCATTAAISASGTQLMCSTVGTMIAYSSASGAVPVGVNITSAAAGEVFTMALYGFGQGSPGT